MPRVANPPRVHRGQAASPHKQSPIKIPLNDDRHEKAVRLQSRQALLDLQMNQIKAAASPMRRLNPHERTMSSSPKTPRDQHNRGKENMEDGGILATAVTPMKRVPILANFEEWMKMATDNKINATNSWNFALIDYFHDMSLLKEGDGVNFQKASCTLDGCVKIYTSRVDSVATETGKLLSGLADSGNKKHKRDEGGEEEGEEGEDEEGEDGVKKRVRKRAQRSFEATLAPSFAPLSLKKFELEFSVDPLFKKASADFDEGGAKGLLLNHLAIDGQGRIVFDSSDDAEAAAPDGEASGRKRDSIANDPDISREDKEKQDNTKDAMDDQDMEIDLSALGSKFFPDLSKLDAQDICPSLKNLDLGDSTGLSDIPFLKVPEEVPEERKDATLANLGDKSGIFLDDDNAVGFDDDNEPLDGFEIPQDTGFGEGGEAWARDAALEPQLRVHRVGFEEGAVDSNGMAQSTDAGGFGPTDSQYAVSMRHGKESGGHEDILKYFDNALQKTWAGPEHWRIRRIKDSSKALAPAPAKRKEKEPFQIDFASPLDPALAELIYTPASSNAAISLPKTQWTSKT
ncbi:MAG: hypothetical protein Q9187_003274, partial [Circinaria calcarea]